MYKQDKVHDKLELFRRVACVDLNDIESMFKGSCNYNHLLSKYEMYREDYGEYGNFKFLFYLDNNYAKMFFDYLGLRDVTLEKKDSLLNSIKLIQEEY